MEHNEEAIRKFLYEVYGYGKVAEFLRGQKEQSVRLRDFLDGTIIGTYRRSAITPEGTIYEVPVRWPGLSKIRTTEEAKREGGLKREDLPYHISNQSFFEDYDEEMVRRYLENSVLRLFPHARFTRDTTIKPYWGHALETEDFGLYVKGTQKKHSKTVIVDFKAPEKVKENLNSIVRSYHHWMNQLKNRP